MDEGIGALLVVLGIGTIIFFVVWHGIRQAESLDGIYTKVARRWGGRCIPGGFLGRPWIAFKLAGVPAKVDIYSTGGKRAKLYTQLHVQWLDPELRCEVYPEQFLHGVGKMLGMEDIQIGSPDFDDRFMICGNSVEAIRRLLSQDVQLAIEALRRLLGNNDIYISIRGGSLLVKKRSLIRDETTLERFIQLGARLYEVAAQTNTEGIDFIAGDQRAATLSLASAICQVCGEEVAIDAVFCRSCKTPHHEDCWQYYGSCSTYGCGQKRFLIMKKPAARHAQNVRRRPS